MTDLPHAYFVRHGDQLVPTGYSRGPWDPGSMHAGPPSALLAAEALRAHPRDDARLVRIAVEILGPVPLQPVTVTSEVERRGRKVELLQASLHAGGREVMRARLWRMRSDPSLVVPEQYAAARPSPPPPAQGVHQPFFAGVEPLGYGDSLETAFLAGAWREVGPARVWLRMRVALVEGEPVAPHTRVLVVGDSGNGASAAVPFEEWVFVNPEVTVHLLREPVGEWVLLEASTEVAADGIGLAVSRISDQQGFVARGAQSLFVDRR